MPELSFVNIHGETVNTNIRVAIKRAKPIAESAYHKGFRVEGHKPGALEDARLKRKADILHAKSILERGERGVKIPAEFNDAYWLNNAKKTAVRAKPYEVLSAAETCRDLAVKGGWLHVVIREIKRESKDAASH